MENICDYKNCKKIGNHKAPIEKDNSKKFKPWKSGIDWYDMCL